MNEKKSRAEKKTKVPTKNSKQIKSIGVLCSGGDSPGMNCAVRAVVRTAIGHKMKVWGIYRGFSGLLEGNMKLLEPSSVGNIIHRGGTILQTSRCPEFHKREIRKEAAHICRRKEIDALVIIGGNGSFQGAIHFSQENDIPVVGIPGTIDNDISGTEYTIGFDTAVQTAIEAVDKIRDTAASHERIFFVEVMGRKSEAIALHVGVCTGAETIIFPHRGINYAKLYETLQIGYARGKTSSIVIVAEDKIPGVSYKIREEMYKQYNIISTVCILGHTQRGGSPTGLDRFIASKMGFDAIKALVNNKYPVVTTFNKGKVTITPFEECLDVRDPYDQPYEDLVSSLAI